MNYYVADDYSLVIRFVYDDVRLVVSCISVIKVMGEGYGEKACPLPRNFLLNSTDDMLFSG